ncbi:MAG: ABC transporter ATP-binding protein [Candidatus Bilamarchaeum sp.]|jgi:ABC-type Fe3+/spermidine/putrescine transport system ATPase subunit
MLRLENITTKIAKRNIIDNISLEVKATQVMVVMGPSGSGKTTLLQTILGVIHPDYGRILIDDVDITQKLIEQREIGYLPQSYGLFPHLSVIENVEYGLKVRGINNRTEAEKMLKLVGLSGFESRRITQLSGGQKQRVGLARALATKPKLLLLDEPLSNIDTITKGDVAAQLKKLFAELKIPTIFVTHSPQEAIYFGDQIAILIDGKIAQIGTPGEIKKKPVNETVSKLLQPF